jgi:hypothetical protein
MDARRMAEIEDGAEPTGAETALCLLFTAGILVNIAALVAVVCGS